MARDVSHPDLLAEILAFCEATGQSKADFGKVHMRDPRFVYDLEAGRECRMATIARAREAISHGAAA